ncbi:MAG: hypothetical protein PHU54_02765 [Candidatus Omnitrophica bacterium]|nr:hypothetical protein [Candidatus Omnitrophota bacterium]
MNIYYLIGAGILGFVFKDQIKKLLGIKQEQNAMEKTVERLSTIRATTGTTPITPEEKIQQAISRQMPTTFNNLQTCQTILATYIGRNPQITASCKCDKYREKQGTRYVQGFKINCPQSKK